MVGQEAGICSPKALFLQSVIYYGPIKAEDHIL